MNVISMTDRQKCLRAGIEAHTDNNNNEKASKFMRKLLLALPLVAGASWAGTTYYSGSQTQPAYDKLLSQLNQLKPLSFVSEEYEAGFIQSTAITKVLFNGAADDNVLFRLKHVIDHSPVGVDNAGARVGANSVVTTLMLEQMNPKLSLALNGRDPMVLHTRVDMSGSTVNDLNLTDFTVTGDDETVEFGGGHFKFVSETSGRVHGGGSTKALTVKHIKGGTLEVAEAPLLMDLQYLAQGIYSGTMTWDSPKIEINDADSGMSLSLNQLKISSNSKVNNDIMDGGFNLSVAQLDAPIPITAFKWDYSISGFPIEGIKKYEKIRHELMDPSAVNDENAMGYVEQMVDAYKAMFAPGTGIKNLVQVSNQGGDIVLGLDLDFLGDGSTSGTDNMQTVRDVLSALILKASLDADASAVDMTPLGMFMGHPLASQYILNDGVKYTTDLKLQDILLYANGETQDIVEMFGLAPMLDTPLDFLGSL